MAVVTAEDYQKAKGKLAKSLGSAYLFLSIAILFLLFKYHPDEDDMKCFGSVTIWWLNALWIAVVVISGLTGCIIACWELQPLSTEKLESITSAQGLLLLIRVIYSVSQYTNTSHDGRIRYWISAADTLGSVFLMIALGFFISVVKEGNGNPAAAEPQGQINAEP